MTHSSVPVQSILAAVGDGIGCRHRYEGAQPVDFGLLVGLGLLQPLRRDIPKCSEHGCPLIGQCEHQVDFEEARSGRANRKFRLTAEGRAAARDAQLLRRLAAEHPLADVVLPAVASGRTTTFAVVGSLVEAAARELDEAGDIHRWRLTKREVAAYLHLLVSLGTLVLGRDGITIRGATPDPRGDLSQDP